MHAPGLGATASTAATAGQKTRRFAENTIPAIVVAHPPICPNHQKIVPHYQRVARTPSRRFGEGPPPTKPWHPSSVCHRCVDFKALVAMVGADRWRLAGPRCSRARPAEPRDAGAFNSFWNLIAASNIPLRKRGLYRSKTEVPRLCMASWSGPPGGRSNTNDTRRFL